MRYGDGMVVGVAVIVALLLGALIGLLAWGLASGSDQTFTVGCATKGANIYQKSTKDGKYTTIWCVKNGRVVP